MARAARKQIRKTPARKAPIRKTAKRVPPLPGKFQAMVANLNVSDLDALIKAATDRKNDQLAGARASFLDEVKARVRPVWVYPSWIWSGRDRPRPPLARRRPMAQGKPPLQSTGDPTAKSGPAGDGQPAG
jgi:hypothetical protein